MSDQDPLTEIELLSTVVELEAEIERDEALAEALEVAPDANSQALVAMLRGRARRARDILGALRTAPHRRPDA